MAKFSLKLYFNTIFRKMATKPEQVERKTLKDVNPKLAKKLSESSWAGLYEKSEPLDAISKYAKEVVLRVESAS